MFDQVPNDSYAYGVVNIDEYLDAGDILNIVNDMLRKNEQAKILNKTESSTQFSQEKFSDIDDNSNNISEIK